MKMLSEVRLSPPVRAALSALRWSGLVAVAFAFGCGPPTPDKPAANSYENLGAINAAYFKATKKMGRPPAKLADIEPFLRENGEPEILLTSPVDGEPYVIVWGIDIQRMLDRNTPPVVAYEKTGKDGKRFVSNGHLILQFTDDQFEKAKASAGLKSSS